MTRQITHRLGLSVGFGLALLITTSSAIDLNAQGFKGLPAANSAQPNSQVTVPQQPASNLGGGMFAPMKMPTQQSQIKPGTQQRFGQSDPLGQVANKNHAAAQKPADPWQMTARVHLEKGSTKGYLVLQVDLAEGHYIYAVTPGGSPAPTKINATGSAEFQLLGNFGPDQQPIVIEKDPLFEQRVEKHKGTIQFFAPIEVHPSLDLTKFNPEVTFVGQVCSDAGFCVPLRDKKIVGSFAGYFERSAEENSQSQQRQGQVQSQTGGVRR